MKKTLLAVLMLLCIAGISKAQLPAFPGAQGGGALSVGGSGRNGTGTPKVMLVTNLNDSGSGSLRACMSASGPRTCIFRVSGYITAQSRLDCTDPYLTVAGQTVPGGGIILGGPGQQGEQFDIQCHDVIGRFLTYDGTGKTGPDGGTVGFEEANGGGDVHDVIFDHMSSRWMGNKILIFANDTSGVQKIKNSTWQWMLIYEPNTAHPVGVLESSNAFPAEMVNNDIHHTIWMNEGHRLPLVAAMDNWRLVSMYSYNWDYFAIASDGSHGDMIDNFWDQTGNLNGGDSNPHPYNGTLGNDQGVNCLQNCDIVGTPSIYMSGNTCTQFGTDYQCSAEEGGTDPEGFPETASPIRASWQRHTPLPAEPIPIVPDAASTLKVLMTGTTGTLDPIGNWARLDCHGNLIENRDTQDRRVLLQLLNGGSGGQYNGPGYNDPTFGPTPAAGTPCAMSLNDGIYDQWKTDNDLSTTDTTLWSRIAPNGYTYLENFLNGTNATTGGGGGGGCTTNCGGGGGTGGTTPPGSPNPPTGLTATPH